MGRKLENCIFKQLFNVWRQIINKIFLKDFYDRSAKYEYNKIASVLSLSSIFQLLSHPNNVKNFLINVSLYYTLAKSNQE